MLKIIILLAFGVIDNDTKLFNTTLLVLIDEVELDDMLVVVDPVVAKSLVELFVLFEAPKVVPVFVVPLLF